MKEMLAVMPRNDVQLTIRVDKGLKENAENLFSHIGLSMSTAINVFLRKSVEENAIPFILSAKKSGYGAGHSAEEITNAFNDALQKDFTTSREKGLPVARYDADLKKAYIEHVDGRREYV